MPPLQVSNESFWIIIVLLVAIEIALLRLCFISGKLSGFEEGWDAQKDWKIRNVLRDESISDD